jgi:putative cardiolipin synthase
VATLAAALFLAACAAPLRPAKEPVELATITANSALWQQLNQHREGDWFHLLNTGDEGLEWRLRSIDSATQTLDLQTFIWKNDHVGQLIQAHVLAAADRGVKVRIMLDDSFLSGNDRSILALAQHPRIHYHIYNPATLREDSLVSKQLANLNDFQRLDHRMHNKVMVVDSQVAIIGGRNLADEYFGYNVAHNFRDMEVLAWGEIVGLINGEFDRFWNDDWSIPAHRVLPTPDPGALPELREQLASALAASAQPAPGEKTTSWLQIASQAHSGTAELLYDQPLPDPSEPGDMQLQLTKTLLGKLAAVDNEIIILSAYYVPTPRLEQLIVSLEQRGVEVRLLTNSLDTNNHTSAHAVYKRHRKTLLQAGADMHEVRADAQDRALYMQQPIDQRLLGLHAKTLVVDDDQVFVGSTNLDPRSLRLNTEVGLWITSPALNQSLRQHVVIDLLQQNAWQLALDEQGTLLWKSADHSSYSEPAASFLLRFESWLFGLLPIENEM